MPHSPTSPFPLYLLPSLPFRRRHSSTSTSSPPTSPTSSSPSSPQPTGYLSPSPTSHLQCYKCLTDLLPTSSIISKGFTGRHGRAYLVAPPSPTPGDIPNTLIHKPVSRQLVTGAHTVSDISCRQCGIVLGWKYVEAKEESQKYKVGKYILETRRVVRGVRWDGDAGEEVGVKGVGEEIEFDSQDEDECEDLFSGVWTEARAGRRRGR